MRLRPTSALPLLPFFSFFLIAFSLCLSLFFLTPFSDQIIIKAQNSDTPEQNETIQPQATTNQSSEQLKIIGTHLGEGDYNAQREIMDLLAARISPERRAGFPVTIQVYPPRDAAGLNSFQQNMNMLAATAKQHGFFTIIRVDDMCYSYAQSPATNWIGAIRTAFGGDAPIEIGNEINNTGECKNGDEQLLSNYKPNYEAARAADSNGKTGPAALDFYHGINPPSQWISQIGFTLSNYTGPVFFANAYGCMGDTENTSDTCQPQQTNSHEQGYSSYNRGDNDLYLTEFSLSPGNGNKNNNAADTNLRNVVDFIQSKGPETPAKAITPLIRNVCNSDGAWLLFISSYYTGAGPLVLTKSGTPINIASCTQSSSDDYFLYPIAGINESHLPPTEQKSLIKNELAKQGYQAQCLSPRIDVSTVVSTLQPQLLYEQVGTQEQLTAEFSQTVDFLNAKIPGWRQDGTNDIALMNSLETLFGFYNTPLDDHQQTINSAPLYRRTTQTQQCVLQTKMLTTIENMCNTLADPLSCILDDPIKARDGSSSPFTLRSLRNRLIAVYGADALSSDEHITTMCGKIQSGFGANGTAASKPDDLDLIKDALEHTPLYISKAYRLGFMVMAARLPEANPEQVSDSSPFRFLAKWGESAAQKPDHVVRIFAFRLPDAGTNKDPQSPLYYQDPLEITRNTILTNQDQEKVAKAYDQLRSHRNNPVPEHINCFSPDGQGINSPYCNDSVVVQSLVEFVNETYQGSINACDQEPKDLPIEKLSTIFSSANLGTGVEESGGAGNGSSGSAAEKTTTGQTFPAPNQQPDRFNIVARLREYGIGQSTVRDGGTPEFSFLADAKLRKDNSNESSSGGANPMSIRTFLIMPVGFQLNVTEQTLSGRFMTQTARKDFYANFGIDIEQSQIGEYATLDPANLNLASNQTALGKISQTAGSISSRIATIARYFSIQDLELRLDSSAPHRGVVDCTAQTEQLAARSNDPNADPAATPSPCQDKELRVDVESIQDDHAPRYPGGILSRIVIEMQKAVTQNESEQNKSLENVQSIEPIL